MPEVILFNKPFNVLSQFTDSENRTTLASYIKAPHFRAAGRLDYDSEGLLVLTDDGQLQHRITSPRYKLPKTYWAQVEGVPTAEQLHKLELGVELNDGPTLPATVRLLPEVDIWPRNPPIRHRLSVPTAWIELTITEGRNRQVRRMTAAVGLPTLRLVRIRVGDWRLGDLAPGMFRREQVSLASQPGHARPPAPRRNRQRRRGNAQLPAKPV